MAIVPLQSVTLIGELKRRDAIVLELQRLGCVHLVDLAAPNGSKNTTSDRHGDLKAAIAYLEQTPEKRPAPSNTATNRELKRIAAEALEIQSESRTLAEEQEEVAEKVDQTLPWGNFHQPTADELAGRHLYFYRLTHQQVARIKRRDGDRIFAQGNRIHSDRRNEYWLFIAEAPIADMPVEPEELDPRPLEELQARLLEISEQREQLQLRRIALTRWLDQLRSKYVAIQDENERIVARGRSLVEGPIFALQGWAPKRRIGELETFARRNTLAFESHAPCSSDDPPTLLSNPAPIAGAEGAVTFFMTPGYRTWDPTWVMFFSFSAFFAMILADAGYGLVLGAILAVAAKKLGRSESGRRFRQLATFMVFVSMGYGILIGSYFGFSPPSGTLLDRVVIKSGGVSIMQDREAMMFIAATIGVFHLILANVIVTWRWFGSSHALSSAGWVVALLGGWVIAVAMLPKPDMMSPIANWFGGEAVAWKTGLTNGGAWMLGIGLGMVFLFSSTRPLLSKSPRDWLMRIADGFMGLTNVTKAFGDALSYLRLFALGLASAQLAIVFNGLAEDASQMQGVGVLLGLLIFLIGHTLNLVLAVVGGVVHGLRLNCIEFFGWSLTDEGQPFEAFEMKADK
ncbi:V-type ATP synthase subunit I [Novipirellula aureliae]|uniref:V-type ATP synthase subunit I n=1 Tax=Novipirellula aureliae TaxID=2527966 RepID=A0A5C6EC39_9BACT|nr:V-type ATP synthase subunit I [Novipirellula aureliae]TWU45096.1 V-type ATP synthase subunit I [Novipirellula aureliae]